MSITLLLGGSSATALAWWVFSQGPAHRVQVGTTALEAFVPVHYQASAFPAFGALGCAVGLDLLRGKRKPAVYRLGLLVVLSGLAALRLAGYLPLSGHGLCCAAILAESAVNWRPRESTLLVVLGIGGLVVTTYYKFFVWGDFFWFLVSLALGALLGLACGAALRERRGKPQLPL